MSNVSLGLILEKVTMKPCDDNILLSSTDTTAMTIASPEAADDLTSLGRLATPPRSRVLLVLQVAATLSQAQPVEKLTQAFGPPLLELRNRLPPRTRTSGTWQPLTC